MFSNLQPPIPETRTLLGKPSSGSRFVAHREPRESNRCICYAANFFMSGLRRRNGASRLRNKDGGTGIEGEVDGLDDWPSAARPETIYASFWHVSFLLSFYSKWFPSHCRRRGFPGSVFRLAASCPAFWSGGGFGCRLVFMHARRATCQGFGSGSATPFVSQFLLWFCYSFARSGNRWASVWELFTLCYRP